MPRLTPAPTTLAGANRFARPGATLQAMFSRPPLSVAFALQLLALLSCNTGGATTVAGRVEVSQVHVPRRRIGGWIW